MSESVPRSDVTVNGGGTIGTGSYATVTINGAGTVTGDIDCTTMRINGAGTVNGTVTATSITVNGSGTFNSTVQAGEIITNGEASFATSAGIGRLRVKGRTAIAGSLAAHEVDLRGILKVDGDLSTDAMIGEGGFTIGGLLNAGSVDLQLYGPCSVREIGGESVRVLQSRSGLADFVNLFSEKRLHVTTVEADNVMLENTTAQSVRGTDVVIGTGCDVALVEYSGTYQQAPDARVGEARQVAAG